MDVKLARVHSQFDCTRAIFTFLAKPGGQYAMILGTKAAVNDISGAMDRSRVEHMILRDLIFLQNANLAQEGAQFNCTHAVFILLAELGGQHAAILGTKGALNDISDAIERSRVEHMILHSLSYSLNTELAQLEPREIQKKWKSASHPHCRRSSCGMVLTYHQNVERKHLDG